MNIDTGPVPQVSAILERAQVRNALPSLNTLASGEASSIPFPFSTPSPSPLQAALLPRDKNDLVIDFVTLSPAAARLGVPPDAAALASGDAGASAHHGGSTADGLHIAAVAVPSAAPSAAPSAGYSAR